MALSSMGRSARQVYFEHFPTPARLRDSLLDCWFLPGKVDAAGTFVLNADDRFVYEFDNMFQDLSYVEIYNTRTSQTGIAKRSYDRKFEVKMIGVSLSQFIPRDRLLHQFDIMAICEPPALEEFPVVSCSVDQGWLRWLCDWDKDTRQFRLIRDPQSGMYHLAWSGLHHLKSLDHVSFVSTVLSRHVALCHPPGLTIELTDLTTDTLETLFTCQLPGLAKKTNIKLRWQSLAQMPDLSEDVDFQEETATEPENDEIDQKEKEEEEEEEEEEEKEKDKAEEKEAARETKAQTQVDSNPTHSPFHSPTHSSTSASSSNFLEDPTGMRPNKGASLTPLAPSRLPNLSSVPAAPTAKKKPPSPIQLPPLTQLPQVLPHSRTATLPPIPAPLPPLPSLSAADEEVQEKLSKTSARKVVAPLDLSGLNLRKSALVDRFSSPSHRREPSERKTSPTATKATEKETEIEKEMETETEPAMTVDRRKIEPSTPLTVSPRSATEQGNVAIDPMSTLPIASRTSEELEAMELNSLITSVESTLESPRSGSTKN